MKQWAILAGIICIVSTYASTQQNPRLDYISKIPVTIRDCGALYTYDTVDFAKKKFILVVDFQNRGVISIAGKRVNLQLTNTQTIETTNISTYEGAGYTVVLSVKAVQRINELDMEKGKLQISKGKTTRTIKIHGQSGCDESKQEGNAN